ncbi:glycoside hydrolase family 125 protein [Francisella sp. 19X1-34]|uniref:glycoside hydrolase family 125 protein n=1 Tax=Francisella sp. 19X1-34 TaxID=3087177 RepID=UPI002E2F79F5|nr:glycoside hydrolase family 125 protein [Francisella sp. 19X1-34]MED7787460.1 glycoside hydrolase family 125 protein [Francisella sp. 19X1-34]
MGKINKNSESLTKPYDLGNGYIMSSISPQGKIISLNTTHNKHGIVKLAPLQRFPEGKWYDPSFVRSYRNSFLSNKTAEKGYGLDFNRSNERINLSDLVIYDQTNSLFSQTSLNQISISLSIFTVPKSNLLIQKYSIKNQDTACQLISVSLNGLWGIIRASYAQITENGPIAFPETNNLYQKIDDHTFMIDELGTGSYLKVSLISSSSINWNLPDTIDNSNKPVYIDNTAKFDLDKNSQMEIYVCYSLSDNKEKLHNSSLSFANIQKFEKLNAQYWKKFQIKLDDERQSYIISRNFAYTYGCCCLKENGAMITDHQSLPLTWNRDNYFMFKLLESVFRITNQTEIKDYMLSHIYWLFTYMTNDGWGRSHVINGKVKDKVFQFDQQCYPILEVYDLLKTCPDLVEKIKPFFCKLDQLSDILLSEKADDVFLFKTEENPADDPVLYPYHFSTQILAWRTFECLNKLDLEYSFSKKDFGQIAYSIKADIMKYMITEHNGKKLFCYTTDLQNHELYHDANDLPTALAPYWGFIKVDDEVFYNTIKWSFSAENRGYYSGEIGGLGSDHAKGHWPLGTAQLLAISLVSKNEKLWCETVTTLDKILQKDGLFSESVYPDTGKVNTRYWFAWPGATISWLYLLKHFDLD